MSSKQLPLFANQGDLIADTMPATATDIVAWIFGKKKITKKIVKDDEIVFCVSGKMPVYCISHDRVIGKEIQSGIIVREENYKGELIFNRFYGGAILR